MMKKVIVFVSALLIGSMLWAQEPHARFEYALGFSHQSYLNYSAMSLFKGGEEQYSASGVNLSLGLRTADNTTISLDVFDNGCNTGNALDEQVSLLYFGLSLMPRYPLGERWDLAPKVGLGAVWASNSLTLPVGGDQNYDRWGFGGMLEVGAEYHYRGGNYFRFSFFWQPLIVKDASQLSLLAEATASFVPTTNQFMEMVGIRFTVGLTSGAKK